MFARIYDFLNSDSGAVTVDWVVLTAAVVGLGLASAASIRTGTSALGSDINASLSNAAVASLGELGDDGYAGRYVETGGRGVQSYSPGGCDRNDNCTPGTTTTHMTYNMDDGSVWSMRSTQVDGEEAVVTWFDDNGDEAEAPRFRD